MLKADKRKGKEIFATNNVINNEAQPVYYLLFYLQNNSK
jgi:hypothetical protein